MTKVEPGLRHAFRANYGVERGRDATAEALAYAWEHWSRVSQLANPSGYLYRVGRSKTRVRRFQPFFERPVDRDIWIEPGLPEALASLPMRQRVAVFLVHGYDTPVKEVAAILGVREATVHTHLRRGLTTLRNSLNVERTHFRNERITELEDQKGQENA